MIGSMRSGVRLMARYFNGKPVHSGTKIIDGVTNIFQRRRVTRAGRYRYEERVIKTAANWVRTEDWYKLYNSEMPANEATL